MIKKLIYSLFLFLFVFSLHLNAQNKNKNDFLLGISINPIIPNNMIQNNDVILITDSITYNFFQKPALSYGLEIRYGFHERFSLNFGINYCQRNFKVNIYEDDSIYVDSILKFISYDIPIFMSGYVKLSKNFYLDGKLGLGMDFYPTSITVPHVYGKRYHWAQFAVIGGTGIELRTTRSGYFYLGMSYKAHLHDMLYILFYEGDVIGSADEYLPFSGNYFSLNIKYYFP